MNTHQNGSQSIQNENGPKTSTTENSPKKESPRELDQRYAGGGYAKSPNPKSLGKPKFLSKSNPTSPTRESNHLVQNTSSSPTSNTSSVSYDAQSFFSLFSAQN